MGRKILMIGAGAVGGYVGAHLAKAGEDVTLVDMWHENVEAIKRDGVMITGLTPGEDETIPAKGMHIHEVSSLANTKPVDIAIISMKSYDTAWATTMIKPYLAPDGYIVSLQNCINEEVIASIVGWGKVVGCIASRISVEIFAPGRIRRQSQKSSADHTVFRVGEIHGRTTARTSEMASLLGKVDGTKITSNLWGERWAKLSHNAMRNAVSAVSGLSSAEVDLSPVARSFVIGLGHEAVRVGTALGFQLEKVGKLDPELLSQASSPSTTAYRQIETLIIEQGQKNDRGELQRASTRQDIIKGRRTEVDFINGYIFHKAKEIGLGAPFNDKITSLVKQLERGAITADISHLEAAL